MDKTEILLTNFQQR